MAIDQAPGSKRIDDTHDSLRAFQDDAMQRSQVSQDETTQRIKEMSSEELQKELEAAKGSFDEASKKRYDSEEDAAVYQIAGGRLVAVRNAMKRRGLLLSTE